MHEYRIFTGADSGVFGSGRTLWLANDGAAMLVGRHLLRRAAGIDIWQGPRRVALLRRRALIQP